MVFLAPPSGDAVVKIECGALADQTLVVVESPAKAKTINKYLGGDYTVLASFGHVRDLPPKDGSVRPDEDFAMDWELADRGKPAWTRSPSAAKDATPRAAGHRPGSRGRGDLLACAAAAARPPRAEGRRDPPGHLQRDHQARRPRRHRPSARPRPGADRGLSGPPRAGLSGRLHPVAGAVAQAAGQPLAPAACSRWRCA